jgi:hypothetical protein
MMMMMMMMMMMSNAAACHGVAGFCEQNAAHCAEWRCHWHLQASAGLLLQVATLLLPVSTAAADVV